MSSNQLLSTAKDDSVSDQREYFKIEVRKLVGKMSFPHDGKSTLPESDRLILFINEEKILIEILKS